MGSAYLKVSYEALSRALDLPGGCFIEGVRITHDDLLDDTITVLVMDSSLPTAPAGARLPQVEVMVVHRSMLVLRGEESER